MEDKDTCIGCIYLGMHFTHLNGHENVNCWYNCSYPLPFHASPKAVRIDIKYSCKVKVKKNKMKPISVEDKLPKNKTYVLAHYSGRNWGDKDEGQFWVVARFTRGISIEERKNLFDTDSRKNIYKSEDEHFNNRKPYEWQTFGALSLFGQDVDYWMPLPIIKK
jgi:hypothetical protein